LLIADERIEKYRLGKREYYPKKTALYRDFIEILLVV